MAAGGEVDPLGEGVKDLITTMNDLEKLGLGSLNIPLAKCVVCGKLLIIWCFICSVLTHSL